MFLGDTSAGKNRSALFLDEQRNRHAESDGDDDAADRGASQPARRAGAAISARMAATAISTTYGQYTMRAQMK